jgi:hypothetical protein
MKTVIIANLAVLGLSKPRRPVADNFDNYYNGIDAAAQDDDLKGQLKALINPHVVYSYDEVWNAFEDVDQNLPNYPCDANSSHIPDVYSTFCWTPEKISGGECGNYKKEGDCYNREHLWPKSWFGGECSFTSSILLVSF